MPAYDTDLCVRINVPLKELSAEDDGKVAREEMFAEEVMGRVVRTLDLRDEGLFGV
jgi:hypothetical protein